MSTILVTLMVLWFLYVTSMTVLVGAVAYVVWLHINRRL